ncbi:MAG: alpha/beta hydrolase [Myxococcota bacterium]|nr:alpha/beta hydrolase [Myxococcota bacterium]
MRITSRGVLIATFLLLAACGRGEDTNNQNQTTVTPAPDDGMPDASTEEMGNEADMAEGSDMPADMPVDMTAQPDMTVPMSGARLLYDPASEDFFSLPFPSDARLDAEGKFSLAAWSQAYRNPTLKLWFDAGDELLDGFSTIAGVFLTFDAPIDTATLPTSVQESMSTENGWPSVFLADVDPDSPDRGKLFPIECQFNTFDGKLRVANQLGCKSPFGVVRRTNTRYAFVVTDKLHAADGEVIGAGDAMASLLSGQDVQGKDRMIAAAPYTEALSFLGEQGLDTSKVVALSLFTTGDPTARLKRVHDFYDTLPTPSLDPDKPVQFVRAFDDYVVLAAFYTVPIVQDGDFPYSRAPDGKIKFGADGEVEQVDSQSIRVYLTIPRRVMPENGYPVLMFLHGSGGVAEQLMDRGPYSPQGQPPAQGLGPAAVVAPYGIAGFAADFQFHGMRFDPPDTTGLKLYNLLNNPRATVDNFLVAANEVVLHARLLSALTIDPDTIVNLPEGMIDIGAVEDGLMRFDDARFVTMGQSMGSTIGLPAINIDKITAGTILSGSGGVLIEIAVTSEQPVNVGALLRTLLRYDDEEPLDQFDPVLHAIQHVWDLVDPMAHAHRAVLEPYEGFSPKHILQHSGLQDGYFSPQSRAGLSTALGLDLVEPVKEPVALEIMALGGHGEPIMTPAHNNAGEVTAVAVQYEPSVLDGHHVAYQRDDAKAQYACFVYTTGEQRSPVLASPEQATPETCTPRE